MDTQRRRNLTTGRLHTKMEDIYKDVEFLTGAEGVFTHQLPNAFRAMQPWLRERVTNARFWDEKYDTTHTGETAIEPMTEYEQAEFWKRYGELPHPFAALMG